MRVSIELDTNDITDRDRRVLAALVSDDSTPLVLPIRHDVTHGLGVPDDEPVPAPGMPSPTPAPPAFMQRLGEATAQFGRSPGAAHEARLPVVQQAGVRTRSTMPEDDDAVDAGTELEADLIERMESAELGAQHGGADARVPEPIDVDGPPVQRMTQTARIPRASVEQDPAPKPEDRVRQAILGTVDAPVRHTSP